MFVLCGDRISCTVASLSKSVEFVYRRKRERGCVRETKRERQRERVRKRERERERQRERDRE